MILEESVLLVHSYHVTEHSPWLSSLNFHLRAGPFSVTRFGRFLGDGRMTSNTYPLKFLRTVSCSNLRWIVYRSTCVSKWAPKYLTIAVVRPYALWCHFSLFNTKQQFQKPESLSGFIACFTYCLDFLFIDLLLDKSNVEKTLKQQSRSVATLVILSETWKEPHRS